MKQLETAFRKAGAFVIKPADYDEKLQEMMQRAIRMHAGNADATIDHFIKLLLDEDDARLVWHLVLEVRMTAVRRLHASALHRLRSGRPASPERGARRQNEAQAAISPSVPPPPPSPPPARASSGSQVNALPVVARPMKRPEIPIALEVAITASRLDTVRCGARPIGDLRPDELERSAEGDERLARFKRELRRHCGVIAEGDNRLVRDCISAAEADNLWIRALEMTDAR